MLRSLRVSPQVSRWHVHYMFWFNFARHSLYPKFQSDWEMHRRQ
jgi:hypothetical protein